MEASVKERLDEMLDLLRRIFNMLSSNSPATEAQEELLQPEQVRDVLKISESTLYRLKKAGVLVPYRIGNRDYYTASSIYSSARRFMK